MILDKNRGPQIMGVVNVTPDSFSDGGNLMRESRINIDSVLRLVSQMIEDGADIVDIGGESTRPGAKTISEQEELERVLPAIEVISKEFGIPISVDTSSPSVITEAAKYSVDLINDVRALQREGALMAAARTGLPVCLMHMQNQPQNMQKHPKYTNIEEEILEFLINRKKACVEASISPEKILFDPGFGFGKNLQHNLQLFRALPKFISTGQPILIGISRKTMVGEITKVKIPSNRTIGSVAFALLAAQRGVAFLRVHDILETKQALLVLESIGLDKDNQ